MVRQGDRLIKHPVIIGQNASLKHLTADTKDLYQAGTLFPRLTFFRQKGLLPNYLEIFMLPQNIRENLNAVIRYPDILEKAVQTFGLKLKRISLHFPVNLKASPLEQGGLPTKEILGVLSELKKRGLAESFAFNYHSRTQLPLSQIGNFKKIKREALMKGQKEMELILKFRQDPEIIVTAENNSPCDPIEGIELIDIDPFEILGRIKALGSPSNVGLCLDISHLQSRVGAGGKKMPGLMETYPLKITSANLAALSEFKTLTFHLAGYPKGALKNDDGLHKGVETGGPEDGLDWRKILSQIKRLAENGGRPIFALIENLNGHINPEGFEGCLRSQRFLEKILTTVSS